MATKVYLNTTKEPMQVLGIGEIPAGEHVSLTAAEPQFLPPIIMENHPGLVDITDLEEIPEVEAPDELSAEEPVEETPNEE